MTPERWRAVESIYHEASGRPADERSDVLAEACEGDEDLRREVEELLAQDDASGNILDRPVQQLLEPELQPGQLLGPYRIAGLIGSGGMGRVYRAVDTRLGRSVAIKVSRAGFTGRFRREATAGAALNHPHICTLYDLGPNYLVMEYVEGAPLQGPMPLAQALNTAISIADALDAAHSKGVIHRDLKPSNIMLTESGPKLLDFGLAKLEASPGSVPDSTTWASTLQTTIAGTIQYMSPEQLQGRGADVRSDIFSFGLVFFEMLTGKHAFEADNPASLIAAVLTSRPQTRRLAPGLPASVERVLDRALAKNPEERWQSARELKAALQSIAAAIFRSDAPRGSRAPWVIAALFGFTTILLAWSNWGPAIPAISRAAPIEIAASSPPQLVLLDRRGQSLGTLGVSADYSNPALSPDGRRLAVSIRDSTRTRDIWVFDLIKGGRTRFTSHPADDTNPVWSPDGADIVYCSDRQGHRDLYLRSSADSPERLLLSSGTNKNPLDWARDGSAIYYNNDRSEGDHDIWMLPLKGQATLPRRFLSGSQTIDWLAISPDNRWMLYRTGRGQDARITLRSLLSLPGEQAVGGVGVMEGHWAANSRELYFISGDSMMAQSVQVSAKRPVLGKPERLFRVRQPNGFGRNAFVVTPDGKRFLIRTGA